MSAGPRLAVFTVKRFLYIDGVYWTYGGFGEYIKSLLPHFSSVVIAGHPLRASSAPPGWYPLSAATLEFAWLPYYEREDECLLRLPEMFVRSRAIVLDADIVNARVPDYSGICGGFWAKLHRKPLFISHIDDWHSRVRSPHTRLTGLLRAGLQLYFAIYRVAERGVCRRSLVFAQGNYATRLYADRSTCHQLVSASHSERDVLASEDLRTRPHKAGVWHIVAVGRHVFVKGHAELLRAVALLLPHYPNLQFKLTIAGEGPLTAEYRRLAVELGISRILALPGQLGREEIVRLFDTADLLVLPSLSEGTPKVIMEAMARGVPIIATDVGGVSAVVFHERTGLLCQNSEPDEIAGSIDRLISSPELCCAVATAGLEVARQNTVERVWGQMMRVVRSTYPALWKMPCD